MPTSLIQPLAAYFDAKDAHDIDRVIAQFAADAHVHDEDQDYYGLEAIRAWTLDGWEKYSYTIEPRSMESRGNETTVAAELTGNFPGSPVTLRFDFRLAGDKIANLVIHD